MTKTIYVVGCIHHGENWHSTPVYGAYTSLKKANKRVNDLKADREYRGNTVCWDIPATYQYNGDVIRRILIKYSDNSSEFLTIYKFLNT